MATKNDKAKSKVIEQLKSAFGDNYLGELDKKSYVQVSVDGELIQVALALSIPKNQLEASTPTGIPIRNGGFDFSNDCPFDVEPPKKAEFTPQEDATLAELMARLGL